MVYLHRLTHYLSVDTTPLTAVSTVSQIVLSMSHGNLGFDVALQQRLNLLGGALANMSAGQACGTPGCAHGPRVPVLG